MRTRTPAETSYVICSWVMPPYGVGWARRTGLLGVHFVYNNQDEVPSRERPMPMLVDDFGHLRSVNAQTYWSASLPNSRDPDL